MGCGTSIPDGGGTTPNNAGDDLARCGISVAFLVEFVNARVKAGWSTADTVKEVIVPDTAERKCRMVDTLDDVHRGQPTYFISHSWGNSIEELVSSIRKFVEEQDGVDLSATFVWLDIFAINQHAFASDLANLSTCVAQASMVLLMLDAKGTVLTRIWCLYEIWKTVMLKGADKLQLLINGLDFTELEGVLLRLDAAKAQATVDADRQRILADITQAPGIQQLNLAIKQCMVDSNIAAADRAQAYKESRPAAFLTATHKCAALLGVYSTQHETAERLYKEALQVGDAYLLPNDPERLRLRNNLGTLLRQRGKLQEAEALLRDALQLSIEQLGQKHPDTLSVMSNLAQVLSAEGHMQEALQLSSAVLVARKEVLGPAHPQCAVSLNDTAVLLQAMGALGDAEGMLRVAVQIWEKAASPEHPQVAVALCNLGLVLKLQGRLQEALECDQRALDIQIKVLGPDHDAVGTTLNNMGQLQRALGRPEEAMPLFTRALQMKEAQYGPVHADVAATLNNMAITSRELGKLEEAEALAQRALETYIAAVGTPHPMVAVAMNNLAMVLEEQGRRSEAKAMYTNAVDMSTGLVGSQHPDTLAFAYNLQKLLELPEGDA